MKGTELDENGNVRAGMQAFKKMELCTMVFRCWARLMIARIIASRFKEIGSWSTSDFPIHSSPKEFHPSKLTTHSCASKSG